MTGSKGVDDQEHFIKVRRREDYAPDEWARLQERWDKEVAAHGPGYCDQPMFGRYACSDTIRSATRRGGMGLLPTAAFTTLAIRTNIMS
jgi:hypothetical protein